MGQFIRDFHVMYFNTLLIILCATTAFARPQDNDEDRHTPLDKNTKDQSKIVNHIKELTNNVVAQEQEDVKVGDLQRPLEFYDTVIKAGETTTTTTTTTTTRRTTTTTTTTTTQATTEELGILPRIVNGITSAIGTIFNGGSILGAAGGNPLFGSIAIGRKKREIKTDLQILRERLIRTGRDRDETDMIRNAVDAALEQLELRKEADQLTDMKQIKEEIFLEIAKRLEEEKIKRQNTIEIKDLRPLGLASRP